MARRNATSAAEYLPPRLSLKAAREAAAVCRGCELYRDATQTVFGRGRRDASIMLVGEMPGNQEDLEGEPFVGPAGRLLQEMLGELGVAANDVYVTNAVKHFRFEQRGKRRLHKSPLRSHIEACKPWLQAEIFLLEPQLIVCLGATAAQALLGPQFRITRERGKLQPLDGSTWLTATYHPAALLRAPDHADRVRMRSQWLDDVRQALEHVAHTA